MSAAMDGTDLESLTPQAAAALQPPRISREIMLGGPLTIGAVPEGSAATLISDAERTLRERVAHTPLVPSAWIRSATQVTPEEAGERKSGRPRINTHRSLSVSDLDNSITYLQRRTRELQKLVRGTQPDAAHATRIVTAAIKDAVRRLCINLPEDKRDAIDDVVANF